MWPKNKKKCAIRVITALVAVAISTGIAGCASGSGAPPPPITPAVATISPNNATLGGPAFTLTLNGSNFVSGAEASFKGSAVPSEFVSTTQLIAVIPASALATAGTFQVTASNPNSSASNSVMFTVNNPVPAIAGMPPLAALQPSSATTGGVAFTLTVRGSNFLPVSQVMWNGSNRTTTFVSSSELQAHVMAADLAAVAKVPITVSNPAPGGGSSNAVNFAVPAATITFESTGALDGSDAANTNNDGNVWTVEPDGTGGTPLTKYTFNASGLLGPIPVWSPDGSKIVFASPAALDGSNGPAVGVVITNIWAVKADGSGLTPLSKLTSNSVMHSDLAWSPDGSKIAFDSNRALDGTDTLGAGAMNIWVMNADGSNLIPLTDLTLANSSHPAWSPDGSKIAFLSDRDVSNFNNQGPNKTLNIWVVNSDGSGRTGVQGSGSTPLTKLTALGANSGIGVLSVDPPAWSLDGTKIAFESSRALDGSDAANTNFFQNIWVMNADGSSPTPLTKLTNVYSVAPAWSPDGSKIALASDGALDGSDAANTGATNNVWIVNADGSGRTPVTKLTGGSFTENIIWSPGGDKFLFDSRRALDGSDGKNAIFNVWIMNADGSGATALTKRTVVGASSLSPRQP